MGLCSCIYDHLVITVEHTEVANSQNEFMKKASILVVRTVPIIAHKHANKEMQQVVRSNCREAGPLVDAWTERGSHNRARTHTHTV